MPTAYTRPVLEQDDCPLKPFVLRVARGFGYFYQQRDESLDEPPRPPVVNPDVHTDLLEAHAELEAFQQLSREELAVKLEALRKAVEEYKRPSPALARLAVMRAKVEGWAPPRSHLSLKKSILLMLDEERYFHYSPRNSDISVLSLDEYRARELALLQDAVARAERRWTRHQEEVAEGVEWLRILLEILP